MVLEVRLIRWLGPVSVLAGVLTMALAVTRGEASVYLVLIIPIIVGTWPSCLPGGVLGLCGFPPDVLVMAFPLRSGAGGSRHPARFLGGRTAGPSMGRSPFLGPIPVIFGSDPRMTRTMLLIGAVLFVALVVLTVLALLA